MKQPSKQEQRRALWLGAIVLLAAIVRLVALTKAPSGLNQDEAFAGYEAWSILHYGMDSHGYRFPVYLTAWGSGMNALYSYLSIPFVAVLGATKLAIRLPQAILGTVTVALAYGIGKEVKGERFGLLFAGLLAITPWHIMLSRWGLESNLVVFFLALGMLCYLKALEDRRWLFGWAVGYGLALYCYATVWVVLPIVILLQLWYGFGRGKLRWRELVWPGVTLAALALPLLLFVAVNMGLIPEIRTPILSIPKLLSMRSGEYSMGHMPGNLYRFWQIMTTQQDGWSHNSMPEFGLYYRFSLPIICYGVAAVVAQWWGQRKAKGEERQDKGVCMLFHMVALIPTLLLLSGANINKINSLHLAVVFCLAWGVETLGEHIPHGKGALAVAYALSFLAFAGAYFQAGTPGFYPDADEALAAAKAQARDGRTVYVTDTSYPNVIFGVEYPTDDYVEHADFSNYPSAFLSLRSVGQWRFDPNADAIDPGAIYVCRTNNSGLVNALGEAGFTGETYGAFGVYER